MKICVDGRQAIVANPALEEEQGRIMARAALKAGAMCYVWSTLPSAKQMSANAVNAFIYESQYKQRPFVVSGC